MSDVTMMAYADLAPPALNPRQEFDADELGRLADSIEEKGVLQNLLVRERRRETDDGLGDYEIIAGERRYRALGLLIQDQRWEPGLANVPVRVIEADDGEALALALLENLQREQLRPLEEADAFQKLHDIDPKLWTTQRIADRIGRSRRHVQLRLNLRTRLNDDTQAALAGEKITLRQALAIMAAPAERHEILLERTLLDDGEYRRLRTPEEIRKAGQAGLIPIDRAIFDRAKVKPKLEIFEDPDTAERFFVDGVAFLKAQTAAVERERARLAKKYGTVTIMRDWQFRQSEWESHDTPKEAEAVILFNNWVSGDDTGLVEIHEGIRRKDQLPLQGDAGAAAEGDRQDDRAAREASWKARNERREQFNEAMRAELVKDPVTALRLLALALLTWGQDVHLEDASEDAEIPLLAEAIEECPDDDDRTWFALWQKLEALAPDEVENLLVDITVRCFGVGSYADDVAPATGRLALRYGIKLPEGFGVKRLDDWGEADDSGE